MTDHDAIPRFGLLAIAIVGFILLPAAFVVRAIIDRCRKRRT